jgi:hypothetical protein
MKKRPKPSFRDAVDAVVIGWLPNGPDPVKPDCPPIALRYSKASKASQSASNKGHGTRRSSASKMTKRKRSGEGKGGDITSVMAAVNQLLDQSIAADEFGILDGRSSASAGALAIDLSN